MPTRATVSPGATRIEKSASTGSAREVAEVDVLDDDFTAVDVERLCVRLLGDDGVRVEDVEDAIGGGAGLLGDRDDVGHHPHRREQLREVGGEGQVRAERDLVVDHEIAAEREHADLAERGDRREQRRVLGLDPDVAHPRSVQALGHLAEGVDLAVFLAEALHHADARDRFVDDAGDLARPLQRVPLGRVHLLAQPERHDEQRGHGQEGEQREQR